VSKISVVTPTLRRPAEVRELLENLAKQSVLPFEVILVDGAPPGERETEQIVKTTSPDLPYPCIYIRHGGGTAIQRNAGIDRAQGDFVAFIDDDIRLDPDYFERILEVYDEDSSGRIGGVAGYIKNQHLDPEKSPRWRWYRRLRLFSTYEPGRYDFETGYPINRYLQSPHEGVREIDFMGSNCGVWRSAVIAGGLRFDEFFRDYGMLEDAHFALRARRQWKLVECGRARCLHLHAAGGRSSSRIIGRKSAVNYRYVFMDIVPHRTWRQEFRFWKVQFVDLLRMSAYALRSRDIRDWDGVAGKATGIFAAWRLKPASARVLGQMKLAVVSHKPCWRSSAADGGYATDGGFPIQMGAISEIFASTTLVVPVSSKQRAAGEMRLNGRNLRVRPLTEQSGRGFRRKLLFPFWLARNGTTILREVIAADAVHAPIPGDAGTVGMLCAFLLRKPLLVRHCGNWFVPRTAAEHFWKWFMERFAGGRNVMLATGGSAEPPSTQNRSLSWIFSTSLSERELESMPFRQGVPSGRLLIACRQEREKGTGAVIQALPLILRRFPEARLDVAGDGAALDEFKRLAARLNLRERVTFHGKVTHEEVLGLMRAADLFCYPTRASEGFPKVVLEALACGLPVVSTRVSVIPELLSGGCGVLLHDTNPEAIADAVAQCLGDEVSYRRMAAQSRETARQYSLEKWKAVLTDKLETAWSGVATA
jgi:glycosyltransferase involved in cell wall biosynthesis